MTSSNEERDLIESYNLGVNSYIQKPVDFDQFRTTVKTLGLYWLVVNQPPMTNHAPQLDVYKRQVLRTSMTAAEAIDAAWIRKWQSASGSMYRSRLYSGAG